MGRFHPMTIASSVVLLAGSISIMVALTTTYWSYYHAQWETQGILHQGDYKTSGHRGLYMICHDDFAAFFQGAQTCLSRFKSYNQTGTGQQKLLGSYYQVYPLYAWEYAALILLTMSACFGFGALLLAPLCCHNCLCGIIHSAFVYLAALFALLGMAVYMGFQFSSSMQQNTQSMKFDSFGWSFIVCVLGVIFQFVSAILYTVAACCCHSKDGYTRGQRGGE